MQIYLSKDLCKKLGIKIILRSYKFPEKKVKKKKHFPREKHTCRPAVENRSPGALLASAR